MALKGLDWHREEINACLGIGKLDTVVLNVLPAEISYLRHPAARQQKQAEGGYCRGHLFFGLAQDLAQPLGLFRRQERSRLCSL